MTQDPPIQFRNTALIPEIDRRDQGLGRNLTAARDLERYYDLLDRGSRQIAFSEDEAMAIVSSLQSYPFSDTVSLYTVVDEILDDPETLLAALGSRAAALQSKLQQLDTAGKLALSDTIEQYRIQRRAGQSHRQALIRSGLLAS